jgi:hypothetical protein
MVCPRPELIFLHSANGGGCNAREPCKGQHLDREKNERAPKTSKQLMRSIKDVMEAVREFNEARDKEKEPPNPHGSSS